MIVMARFKLEKSMDGDIHRADRTVGRCVRYHRKQQGLSLERTAELSDLSISMVSKIERGQTSPSVRSVYALSRALNIPVGSLFNDPTVPENDGENQYIVRRGNRSKLDFGKKRLVKELLSPQPLGQLELLMVVLAPGGSTAGDVFAHDGEEGGIVISGALELSIDDKSFVIYPGDSFTFSSTLPHSFRNVADEETQVLWVNTPPIY